MKNWKRRLAVAQLYLGLIVAGLGLAGVSEAGQTGQLIEDQKIKVVQFAFLSLEKEINLVFYRHFLPFILNKHCSEVYSKRLRTDIPFVIRSGFDNIPLNKQEKRTQFAHEVTRRCNDPLEVRRYINHFWNYIDDQEMLYLNHLGRYLSELSASEGSGGLTDTGEHVHDSVCSVVPFSFHLPENLILSNEMVRIFGSQTSPHFGEEIEAIVEMDNQMKEEVREIHSQILQQVIARRLEALNSVKLIKDKSE